MNIFLLHLIIFACVGSLPGLAKALVVIGRLALIDVRQFREYFIRRRRSPSFAPSLAPATCHLPGHTERIQNFGSYLNC